MKRLPSKLLFLTTTVAMVGCAPPTYLDGVAYQVRKRGVGNAAFQTVRGRPHLRVDAFVIDQLEQVAGDDDLLVARNRFNDAIRQAKRLGVYAVNNEIDRLTIGDLQALWRRYFSEEAAPSDLREAVRDRFLAEAGARFEALSHRTETASSVAEIETLAESIRRNIVRSPKDHHGGGLLLSMVAASIKEDPGPPDRGGPMVDVYGPEGALSCECRIRVSAAATDDELLSAYAPIIVQERNLQAPYEESVDRIGTVRAFSKSGNPRIEIDTEEPSVYAYVQHTWIDGRRRTQLTYTHWFPKHPKLKAFDAEAGRIEGATLRITLDETDRPALFETVLNCGCYHRCFPMSGLEKADCRRYGAPLPGKRFCLERKMDRKMDWIIPEQVTANSATSSRPILFSRAGYHGPAGIAFDRDELRDRTVLARPTYRLRCYEELERLPTDHGFVSMFGPDGLVHGAGRPEGWLLALTGMLSAGQPRQRGTQLLHWDQYDFDDPHLLEKCLRLPDPFGAIDP